jgi:hypothetical protein
MDDPIGAHLRTPCAATSARILRTALDDLVQQLSSGNSLDRPAALDLIEKARAEVRRNIGWR